MFLKVPKEAVIAQFFYWIGSQLGMSLTLGNSFFVNLDIPDKSFTVTRNIRYIFNASKNVTKKRNLVSIKTVYKDY